MSFDLDEDEDWLVFIARRWRELIVMVAIGAIGAWVLIVAGVASATREWCQAAGFEDIRLEAMPPKPRGFCVWHRGGGDVLIPAEDVRPRARSST